MNPFDTLNDQDILTAMANSNGVRHPLFIPGESFHTLSYSHDSRIILRSVGKEANFAAGATGSSMCRPRIRRDDSNG